MLRNPHNSRSVRLQLEPLEAREVPAVIYGITQSQRLQTFDSSNPSVLLAAVPILGLTDAGERITDIDVRPGGGGLYGRSDGGRIYLIDPANGFATPISARIAIGASVAMDFDPTSDQLRIITYSGTNFTINPNTGAPSSFGLPARYSELDVARDETPRLASLSFTNSVPFALLTQMYGIDHNTDTLVIGLDNPNLGTFATVGSLGIDVTNAVGFDIDPFTRTGYATFQPAGESFSIFSFVNLNTGAVTLVNTVGFSRPVFLDIAIGNSLFSSGLVTQPTTGVGFAPPTQTVGSPVIAPLFPTVISPPNQGIGLNTGSTVSTTPLFPALTQPLAPGLVGGSFNSFTSPLNSFNQFPFGSFSSSDSFASSGYVF